MTRTHHRILFAILALALLLRLAVAWSSDPLAPYDRLRGGDTWWYLEYSVRLVTDEGVEPLAPAPLYLILLGNIRHTLEPERTEKNDKHVIYAEPGGGLPVKSVAGAPSAPTVRIVQTLQALLGTVTIYFAFRLTRTLANDPRAGLVTAAVLALSTALIVTAADIMTETLYLFFLVAGIAVYVEQVAGERAYLRPLLVSVLVGGLLGLATMTRAALLLFPLGIVGHMLLIMVMDRRQGTRSAITLWGVAALLVTVIAVNSIWTTYYQLRWGEWVVGAKGLSAFFYLGAQGGWSGPEGTDASLGVDAADPAADEDFNAGAQQVVNADPAGYLSGRVRDLLTTYAQPYGTNAFRGPSLKSLAVDWWRGDRNLGGLLALVQVEGFAPKLTIYLTHFGGMALGLGGMALTARRWRVTLAPIGLIAYVTLLHLVLLALPRYLFPTLPFWWAFGGVAVVAAWDVVTQRQSRAADKASLVPTDR
jgi:hypothetical protein